MGIQVINLADRIQDLDTVSRWLWKEWASDKPYSFIRYSTVHNTQRNRIPMTFIAVSDDKPVGTVSIWMNDLRSRQDLYPWMASLYVVEEERNKGIGKMLQDHATEAARELGYESLYLFTEHVGYYERLGWTFMETAPKMNGEETRIYYKSL